MMISKITTRIVATVKWDARPGVKLDPRVLGSAIKTIPWENSNGPSLDRGVELDGHHVILHFDFVSVDAVEIVDQELIDDRTFDCLDCGVDTVEIDEYYGLRSPVWLEANPTDDGMLCIGCVERRLGRQLVPTDFIQSARSPESQWRRSERLQARMSGTPES
jgi:hypothetical protein